MNSPLFYRNLFFLIGYPMKLSSCAYELNDTRGTRMVCYTLKPKFLNQLNRN